MINLTKDEALGNTRTEANTLWFVGLQHLFDKHFNQDTEAMVFQNRAIILLKLLSLQGTGWCTITISFCILCPIFPKHCLL